MAIDDGSVSTNNSDVSPGGIAGDHDTDATTTRQTLPRKHATSVAGRGDTDIKRHRSGFKRNNLRLDTSSSGTAARADGEYLETTTHASTLSAAGHGAGIGGVGAMCAATECLRPFEQLHLPRPPPSTPHAGSSRYMQSRPVQALVVGSDSSAVLSPRTCATPSSTHVPSSPSPSPSPTFPSEKKPRAASGGGRFKSLSLEIATPTQSEMEFSHQPQLPADQPELPDTFDHNSTSGRKQPKTPNARSFPTLTVTPTRATPGFSAAPSVNERQQQSYDNWNRATTPHHVQSATPSLMTESARKAQNRAFASQLSQVRWMYEV
jgi:hypothetical protein